MSIHGIKAVDIMKEPLTISSNAPLREVVMKILNTGIGSLVVVEDNKPIGIVTKRDLIWSIAYSGRDIDEMRVSDVMTKQLITINPDTSIYDIVNIMLNNNISHLPVVDSNNELIGIVCDRDLVELLSEVVEVIKWYEEKSPESTE